MLSKQRQMEITEYILKQGKAYVANLAKTYDVSTETIRRDLNEICKNEKIKKVHGGAISLNRPFREESYEKRLSNNFEEKKAIAKCCAKYIKNNDIIAIDNGSNAECLAHEIFGVRNIKVITNSVPIASILIKKHENGDFTGEIILIGGKISSVTGFLDFSSYISASAASYMFSYILEYANWNGVVIFWIVTTILGFLAALAAFKTSKC